MTKLNLGCGSHSRHGWVNVDKYPPADIVCDLEKPWPWATGEVDEVLFHHSLEHMGATAESFFHIIKELYRVCRNGALVTITVPHPRHDDFINDPTHCRIITPNILELFNKKNNELWAAEGAPNTPLGLQLNVDFEITDCSACIEEDYVGLPQDAVRAAMTKYNNVIKFFTVVWRCRK